MINYEHSIILVVIAAVVTLFLRAVPFAIFSGKREMPAIVRRIADILPTAIMSVLVVYCIKADIWSVREFVARQSTEGMISVVATVIALVGVVGVHLWKRHTLLSIALGTVLYMAGIRLIPMLL